MQIRLNPKGECSHKYSLTSCTKTMQALQSLNDSIGWWVYCDMILPYGPTLWGSCTFVICPEFAMSLQLHIPHLELSNDACIIEKDPKLAEFWLIAWRIEYRQWFYHLPVSRLCTYFNQPQCRAIGNKWKELNAD